MFSSWNTQAESGTQACIQQGFLVLFLGVVAFRQIGCAAFEPLNR
jgi:hypothetical protein